MLTRLTEDDWTLVLEVFRAVLPKRGSSIDCVLAEGRGVDRGRWRQINGGGLKACTAGPDSISSFDYFRDTCTGICPAGDVLSLFFVSD